jgi:hypothetical protein
MLIVNPIYDLAFKYLMENNNLAKKVLSVILDVEVLEVALSHQETIVPDPIRGLKMFRLDFKAVIKEAGGSKKTVLIEMQKSKHATDIQRFRNYLAANYEVKTIDHTVGSEVAEAKPPEYQAIYPIIAIYILGYNLDDLPYLAVTVNRDVINSVNNEKVNVSSFFIDHLTHQAHIIQLLRLPEKQKTRLEKFLLLFNQAWSTDRGYILDLPTVPEEFADIAQYLQGPLMDEDFRRHLVAEEQLDFIFENQAAQFNRKFAAAEKEIMDERHQKESERQLKEAAEKREQEERKLKEAERKLKDDLAINFARQLKKYGASIADISGQTGLRVEDIEILE